MKARYLLCQDRVEAPEGEDLAEAAHAEAEDLAAHAEASAVDTDRADLAAVTDRADSMALIITIITDRSSSTVPGITDTEAADALAA